MFFRKKQRRILVADDDRNIRGIARSILESSGYKVDTVETTARALSKIKGNKYNLLVLDIALPGNMIVMLFQMLKKSKKYSGIPVLFLLDSRTLETLNEERRKVVEAADAYIQKPLRANAFLAKIHELTERREKGKESQPSPKDRFAQQTVLEALAKAERRNESFDRS